MTDVIANLTILLAAFLGKASTRSYTKFKLATVCFIILFIFLIVEFYKLGGMNV